MLCFFMESVMFRNQVILVRWRVRRVICQDVGVNSTIGWRFGKDKHIEAFASNFSWHKPVRWKHDFSWPGSCRPFFTALLFDNCLDRCFRVASGRFLFADGQIYFNIVTYSSGLTTKSLSITPWEEGTSCTIHFRLPYLSSLKVRDDDDDDDDDNHGFSTPSCRTSFILESVHPSRTGCWEPPQHRPCGHLQASIWCHKRWSISVLHEVWTSMILQTIV